MTDSRLHELSVDILKEGPELVTLVPGRGARLYDDPPGQRAPHALGVQEGSLAFGVGVGAVHAYASTSSTGVDGSGPLRVAS